METKQPANNGEVSDASPALIPGTSSENLDHVSDSKLENEICKEGVTKSADVMSSNGLFIQKPTMQRLRFVNAYDINDLFHEIGLCRRQEDNEGRPVNNATSADSASIPGTALGKLNQVSEPKHENKVGEEVAATSLDASSTTGLSIQRPTEKAQNACDPLQEIVIDHELWNAAQRSTSVTQRSVAEKRLEEELFHSVRCKSVEDCGDLIKEITDINKRWRCGKTLLNLAVELGKLEWVERLLLMRADPHVSSDSGHSALKLAEECFRAFPQDVDRGVIFRLVKIASRLGHETHHRAEVVVESETNEMRPVARCLEIGDTPPLKESYRACGRDDAEEALKAGCKSGIRNTSGALIADIPEIASKDSQNHNNRGKLGRHMGVTCSSEDVFVAGGQGESLGALRRGNASGNGRTSASKITDIPAMSHNDNSPWCHEVANGNGHTSGSKMTDIPAISRSDYSPSCHEAANGNRRTSGSKVTGIPSISRKDYSPSVHAVTESPLFREMTRFRSCSDEKFDIISSMLVELSQKIDVLSMETALLKEDTETLIDNASIRGTALSELRTEVAAMRREFMSTLEGFEERKLGTNTVVNIREGAITGSMGQDAGLIVHADAPSRTADSCLIRRGEDFYSSTLVTEHEDEDASRDSTRMTKQSHLTYLREELKALKSGTEAENVGCELNPPSDSVVQKTSTYALAHDINDLIREIGLCRRQEDNEGRPVNDSASADSASIPGTALGKLDQVSEAKRENKVDEEGAANIIDVSSMKGLPIQKPMEKGHSTHNPLQEIEINHEHWNSAQRSTSVKPAKRSVAEKLLEEELFQSVICKSVEETKKFFTEEVTDLEYDDVCSGSTSRTKQPYLTYSGEELSTLKSDTAAEEAESELNPTLDNAVQEILSYALVTKNLRKDKGVVESAARQSSALSDKETIRSQSRAFNEPVVNSRRCKSISQLQEVKTGSLGGDEVLSRQLQAMTECFGSSEIAERLKRHYARLSSSGSLSHQPEVEGVDEMPPKDSVFAVEEPRDISTQEERVASSSGSEDAEVESEPVPGSSLEEHDPSSHPLSSLSKVFGSSADFHMLSVYYELLSGMGPMVSLLLDLLQVEMKVRIEVDFENDDVRVRWPTLRDLDGENRASGPKLPIHCSRKKVYIAARLEGSGGESQLLGWMAVALARICLIRLFKNKGKPYSKKNSKGKENYAKIVKKTEDTFRAKGNGFGNSFVRDALEWKMEDAKEIALISAVPGVIASCGPKKGFEKLKKQVPLILKYYRFVLLPRLETETSELKE
ncbi:uncharacterized protein LOC124172710 [Ischnura elegans]|uniref:uncharacterized protein LOC124172710 n=1 Tax=Ischnura elegans TaxID=197161 RepID=UPI001ED875FE|nr:uncharacterized protein LOC124172710 [Ischnura elegans]XP_046408136.1 uncharacterized protein LOC124172710 [Ischnura elegans]